MEKIENISLKKLSSYVVEKFVSATYYTISSEDIKF